MPPPMCQDGPILPVPCRSPACSCLRAWVPVSSLCPGHFSPRSSSGWLLLVTAISTQLKFHFLIESAPDCRLRSSSFVFVLALTTVCSSSPHCDASTLRTVSGLSYSLRFLQGSEPRSPSVSLGTESTPSTASCPGADPRSTVHFLGGLSPVTDLSVPPFLTYGTVIKIVILTS